MLHLQHVVTQVFTRHRQETILALPDERGAAGERGLGTERGVQPPFLSESTGYLIVDDNGAQAVQKEQQGGVHVMKQVPGLIVLRAQREADLGGPAENRTNVVGYFCLSSTHSKLPASWLRVLTSAV